MSDEINLIDYETAEMLRREYLFEGYSLAEIAKKHGLSVCELKKIFSYQIFEGPVGPVAEGYRDNLR